ncbi:M23 family metallopeptidase [Candidatus Saccharibacteria bacterium]|nr:M23 family metallopeptidase [Candidatus Saccharibacteria bacterium]
MHIQIKNNQSGLAHVGVILLAVAVLAIIGFVGFNVMNKEEADNNQGQQTSQTTTQTSADEADIALQNFGLASLESVLVSEDAVREYSSKQLKGFYVFGDELSGGRINPNFEFASLKSDTQVVAAIDGVIAFIKEQPDSGDMEVFLQPKEGSAWTIGYDHLTDLAVKKGDAVKAGDVLGKPAKQGNGALRFEIQINKDKNGDTQHMCPSTLLAKGVSASLLKDLADMQKSWETTTGLDLYNLDAQNPTGCLKKSMTPSEAEGS